MSRVYSGRWSCGWAMMLLALLVMPMAARADDEKPKAKEASKAKSKEGLQGYYAIIASELQLSEEQRTKLAAALASREGEIKKWDDENGAKLEELTAAQKKAKESGDAAAAKQAGDELKKLKQLRSAVEDESKTKWHAVLTPEQRSHLHGYNLYVGAMIRFSKLSLTDGQKVRAKAMAMEAGKALSPDVSDKDLSQAKLDLATRIEKELFTQEQHDAKAKAATEKGKKTKEESKSQ